MSVNKCYLIGRLGQSPELTVTTTGKSVCNFSVATSSKWKNKSGEQQESTEWHRIVVWGNLAEICAKYLEKGRQVYVEGSLQTRNWDDKNGEKRYTTEINAFNVQFIDSGNKEDNENVKERVENLKAQITTDEVPF